MLQKFLSYTTNLALALVLTSTWAFAKSSPQISAEKIKTLVQNSDILEEEFKQQVYAAFSNNVASVSLFRHPDATKADCKIDAVLLGRKIIDLAPQQVKLVRCVFYDYDRQNEFWEVEVRAQLVNAFARGQIGEQELINSVLLYEDKQKNALSAKFASLSYSGIVEFDSVSKGVLEERRLAIHLRLEELEQEKVPIADFREKFLRIEDAARRGKGAEIASQIDELNKSLDQYVGELIKTGQLQKPELKHAKRKLSGIK